MPSRRCRRGKLNCLQSTNVCVDLKNINSSVPIENEERKPVTDKLICMLCKTENSSVLEGPCGHRFCRLCVEDALLPISACPFDGHHVNEMQLAEFIFLQSKSEYETSSEASNEVEILKERVDSLTVIVNRLIEHMAIRDLLHRAQVLDKKHSDESSMLDSKFTQPEKDTVDERSRNLFTCLDFELLQKLDLNDSNDENSKFKLKITPDNVRTMLPEFWRIATDQNWSDEQRIQRLRIICDPSLQRILDNKNVARKDWAYISSLLSGEHLLGEISMLKYLSTSHQRREETPFQWYLRVCDIVGRALPPGSDQDREIRSSFLRGLNQKYIDSLGSESFGSIGAILERCSTVNVVASKYDRAANNSKSSMNKTCFTCYQQGHVQRNCPQNIRNPDFRNGPL